MLLRECALTSLLRALCPAASVLLPPLFPCVVAPRMTPLCSLLPALCCLCCVAAPECYPRCGTGVSRMGGSMRDRHCASRATRRTGPSGADWRARDCASSNESVATDCDASDAGRGASGCSLMPSALLTQTHTAPSASQSLDAHAGAEVSIQSGSLHAAGRPPAAVAVHSSVIECDTVRTDRKQQQMSAATHAQTLRHPLAPGDDEESKGYGSSSSSSLAVNSQSRQHDRDRDREHSHIALDPYPASSSSSNGVSLEEPLLASGLSSTASGSSGNGSGSGSNGGSNGASISVVSVRSRSATTAGSAAVPPSRDWKLFSLGLRLGALLMLLVWAIWDCVVDAHIRPESNPTGDYWIDAVIPLYRCTGFAILCYWMWGLNVLVWTRFKINYLFLMQLHPRASSSHRQIFTHCITLSLIFLTNFIIYFKMQRGDFPRSGGMAPSILPVGLFIFLALIVLPWPGCGTPSKQWVILFLQVCAAPFAPVTFTHVFVGDVLTSVVKPLIDVAYSFCFIGSGIWLHGEITADNGSKCLKSTALNEFFTPFLSALPLYLRMQQCFRRYYETRQRFPHMINAGKYATAASVVFIGVIHTQSVTKGAGSGGETALWILALIASTCYSYAWDLTQDWGLLRTHQGPGVFPLRADLIYGPGRGKYYAAIVLDLLFRFAWSLTFVPATANSPLGTWFHTGLNPIVTAMEIVRRGVWSFFRVEQEHLTQVVAYQRMMDDPSASAAERELGGEDSEWSEVNEERAAQEQEQNARIASGWKLILEIAVLAAIVISVALVSYLTTG